MFYLHADCQKIIQRTKEELDRFDTGINIQKGLHYFDDDKEVIWAFEVVWPIEDVVLSLRTDFYLYKLPHHQMWFKFNIDFPDTCDDYRDIVRKGLRRGEPTIRVGHDSSLSVATIYYTEVPISALH